MRKILALFFFVFFVFGFSIETKNILLLNSYHQGMTWVENITKGVNDTLEPKKNNYMVYIENMDTKRHFSKEYYESLAHLYKSKYSKIKFDLVLSSDNNALEFLKKYRNDIFGDIPVSFCGVNNFKKSMLEGHTNYTGVEENFSAVETVDNILKLHPNTKQIYVVNDYLTTGRAWEKTMKEQLKIFEDRVKIVYAPNQTIKQMQTSIKSLPKDSALLMGVYFADKNNKYYTYEKLGSYLLDNSQVPTYCLLKFNMSDGVIGGKVISGYYQGAMMAKLGKKILQGTDISKLDIVSESANRFIFNKKGMQKFNVDESQLPENAEIINNEISLYERYEFLVAIIVLFFLISVVLGLFLYYKKNILNEAGILRVLVYGPIVFIPAIIAVLIYSILHNNQITYEKEIETIKYNYTQRGKDIAKIEVKRAVDYIYEEYNRTKKRFESVSKKLSGKNVKLENEYKELFKKRILNYVAGIKYGKTGYMFVLNSKGTLLVHGAYPDMVGDNIFNQRDENGIYYTQEIINNAKTNSMSFTKYLWKNPKTNKIAIKYSYSEYIPEFDMVIGSGIYSEDIDTLVIQKGIELKKENDNQIEQVLFIAFVVIFVAVLLSLVLSNVIKSIFTSYAKELDRKNDSLRKLNESLESKVKEEVRKNQEKDKMLFQQSKMASMGEMLENIAHQWRQPLNAISVSASAIDIQKEHNLLDDEQLDQYTKSIMENTTYLSQTIDDFKEFFNKNKKMEQFSVDELLSHSLNIIKSSLKKYSIEVQYTPTNEVSLLSYKGEFIQALMNILNNAKDALSKSENEDKLIKIDTQVKNNTLIISILDNAGGVPDEIKDKIFEAYFTTKHQSQGTGLGLHMTYTIIVHHLNGTLEVENTTFKHDNKEYKGAKFIISIPLV